MKAVVIAGANANPGAPANWDAERDGPCGRLPVRVTTDRVGRIVSCESAWKPDKHELETLNAGGCVILYVAGWQVPVSLRVEAAETAEQKTPEAKADPQPTAN